ncbi:MAG: CoA ester lyase [Chloroflexota bacterium]
MTTHSTLPKIRRSLLFMPGDSRRKIEKGAQSDADTIIMDLEDGVALSQKEVARQTVCQALKDIDFNGIERLVRINGSGSNLAMADLEGTVDAHPDGYVIPKVEDPMDLSPIDEYLTEVERAFDWPLLSIHLLAVVETARGILKLEEIAGASERLGAILFGAEDLAGDIGATRSKAGWEVFYARSAVVTTCAAYGLQPIDTVFVDLNDLEALAEDCCTAQQMGYLGKLAIHPRQIPVINQLFTPSEEEVAAAQRLIEAFQTNQEAGTGAFELDGKMVDMPMVRAAHRVLARAR